MARRVRAAQPSDPPPQGSVAADVRAFLMKHIGEDLLVVSAPVRAATGHKLTAAQLEVARAVARGASNAEIARERGTSARTVANQVAAIFARLGARSRRDVAAALGWAPDRDGVPGRP
jgi:DNA-binding NarL/FixJ family response regulator